MIRRCCSFKLPSLFLFLRYTGNLQVRRHQWLDRRPSTRPCRYTDPNGPTRDLPARGCLVTIDKETGKVTEARMFESTGNQLLDGAALQAYSQWRFKPGSVTQLKIPIEFEKTSTDPDFH